MKILFVVNAPEFFLSHRLPVAEAAQRAGYTVHIATGPGAACQSIARLGFAHHELPMSRSGRNPLAELRTLGALYRVLRRVRPDVVHLVTIKPVLYGGLLARLVGVPAVVAAISGLGTVFIAGPGEGWMRMGMRGLVRWLYRFALGHANLRVIVQNPDDCDVLVGMGAVGQDRTVLIRGSGVALVAYPVQPEPPGVPVVTFAARLLKDKGVQEFVQAARMLHSRGVSARFWLAGALDPGNLTSVAEQELSCWRDEGVLQVLGHQTDIAGLFARSHIVVLPSYREGLPKTLIEAAACGRAVVTTDVPGCRDAITPGVTGLLVPARNARALADAVQHLLEHPQQRIRMGEAGRLLAEREFAIEQVVAAHLAIYQELLQQPRMRGDTAGGYH